MKKYKALWISWEFCLWWAHVHFWCPACVLLPAACCIAFTLVSKQHQCLSLALSFILSRLGCTFLAACCMICVSLPLWRGTGLSSALSAGLFCSRCHYGCIKIHAVDDFWSQFLSPIVSLLMLYTFKLWESCRECYVQTRDANYRLIQ